MARNNSSSSRTVREKRRDEVMEMVLAGWPYRRIAGRVGVSHVTVMRDVVARLKEGAEVATAQTNEYRERQRQQLESLLRRLWVRAHKGEGAAVDRVLRILEREAKLLGLDAPQRKQIEGPDGGPIVVRPDLSGLTVDELRALCALIAKSQSGTSSS